MEQEQKQRIELKLGEQLTGLSPTVCRRAIAAIRKESGQLDDRNITASLSRHCQFLLDLLSDQIGLNPGYNLAQHSNDLTVELNQAELFLDIVEGVKPAGEEEAERG